MTAQSAEDKLLLSKAYDAIELSDRRGHPCFVGFLNEHESLFLHDHLSPKLDTGFYGGYDGAVRVMFGAGACEDDFPITAIEVAYRREFELRHRDFLGSLTGLLIERSAIGDILVEPGRAVVFVRDEVAPLIFSELTKIGRVGVTLSYADRTSLPVPDDTEDMMLTLSSLRLDTFVAAVCSLSREKAASLIRAELVTVDHVVEKNLSKNLHVGSTVTVRRYGKFRIAEDKGLSKKGKPRIIVKHFR